MKKLAPSRSTAGTAPRGPATDSLIDESIEASDRHFLGSETGGCQWMADIPTGRHPLPALRAVRRSATSTTPSSTCRANRVRGGVAHRPGLLGYVHLGPNAHGLDSVQDTLEEMGPVVYIGRSTRSAWSSRSSARARRRRRLPDAHRSVRSSITPRTAMATTPRRPRPGQSSR